MAVEAGRGEAQMGADLAVERDKEWADAQIVIEGAGEPEELF
jgi:hypothetical protein